jgi:hypothetical protein
MAAKSARVEMPCKIIASITPSVTNRTLLIRIVNLFLRIPLFGLARSLAMGSEL